MYTPQNTAKGKMQLFQMESDGHKVYRVSFKCLGNQQYFHSDLHGTPYSPHKSDRPDDNAAWFRIKECEVKRVALSASVVIESCEKITTTA